MCPGTYSFRAALRDFEVFYFYNYWFKVIGYLIYFVSQKVSCVAEASSWHAQKALEIAKLVINQNSYGYIGTGQIQFSLKKILTHPKHWL